MNIISLPTVYLVHIDNRWLNLAKVRSFEICHEGNIHNQFIVLTWDNGERETFCEDDLNTIIDAINQLARKQNEN